MDEKPLETLEQKELGIIRRLVNETRRWNTTPEIRQRALERTVYLMDNGQAEKTQLGAIKTIVAMERDNQTDEWHEQKLAAEAEKPVPQVNIHADRDITVSSEAILGVLRIRQELQSRQTVLENSTTPTMSAQVAEEQSASASE